MFFSVVEIFFRFYFLFRLMFHVLPRSGYSNFFFFVEKMYSIYKTSTTLTR